eukprot:gb/GECG01007709.1/.p1 GENE.gb/GECG01007709.1/~~gb/GECG01007709.1/.p1  ORF type:complete len:550 (+),score=86.85 gb/GECG01007709.1/:1-1650(+)
MNNDVSKAAKTLRVFPWDRIRLDACSRPSSSSGCGGSVKNSAEPITSDFYDDDDGGSNSTIIQVENSCAEESTKVILVARNIAPKDSEEPVRSERESCGAFIEELTGAEENENEYDTILEWGPLLKPKERRRYKVTLNEERMEPSPAILFLYTFTEVYRVELLLNGAKEDELSKIRQPPRPSAYLFEEVGQAEQPEVEQPQGRQETSMDKDVERSAVFQAPQLIPDSIPEESSGDIISCLRQMLHPSKVSNDGDHQSLDISLESWMELQRSAIKKHHSMGTSTTSIVGTVKHQSEETEQYPHPHGRARIKEAEKNKLTEMSDESFNKSDEDEDDVDKLGSIDMVESENVADNVEAPRIAQDGDNYLVQHASSAASVANFESVRPPIPRSDTDRPATAASASTARSCGRGGSRPVSASSSKRNDSSRQASRQLVHSLENNRESDDIHTATRSDASAPASEARMVSMKPEQWSSSGEQKPSFRGKIVRGGPSISAVRTLRQRSENKKNERVLPECEGSFLRKEWIQRDNDMGLDLDEHEPDIDILAPESAH